MGAIILSLLIILDIFILPLSYPVTPLFRDPNIPYEALNDWVEILGHPCFDTM